MSKQQRRLVVLTLVGLILAGAIFNALRYAPERWGGVGARKATAAEWRASLAFAYTSLLYLAATLLIGPWNLLRRRPNPTHNPLRRDIGLVAAGLAVGHVAFALFIHVDGWRFWENWILAWPTRENPLPLKYTKIGLGNYFGLLQLGLLAVLFAISNSRSLKRLGLRRWKTVQRLNYVAFAAVAAHGLLMQLGERRDWRLQAAFWLVVGVVIAAQLAGVVLWRRRARAG